MKSVSLVSSLSLSLHIDALSSRIEKEDKLVL